MTASAARKPKQTPMALTVEQQRAQQYAALVASLDKPPGKTPPITTGNASTTTAYTGEARALAPLRPQADKALAIPSRVGNRLHHACGRVTDLAGQPIAQITGVSA